jgi:hypothetical protein
MAHLRHTAPVPPVYAANCTVEATMIALRSMTASVLCLSNAPSVLQALLEAQRKIPSFIPA